MNPFNRPLWLLGAIVCVAVLAAACSSPPPSAPEELLLPESGGTPDLHQPSATPAGAPQPPPVATSAAPAPSPTPAEPLATGGREIRLTPTEPLFLEPVPTATEEAVTGEVPEDLLNAILADAADRSGLPVEAFNVLRAEPVTWSDGSLGCPQPGVVYAQVLTQGFRVMLEAGRQVYEYHTGPAQAIVLCEIEAPAPRSDPAPSGMPPILREEIITAPINEDLEAHPYRRTGFGEAFAHCSRGDRGGTDPEGGMARLEPGLWAARVGPPSCRHRWLSYRTHRGGPGVRLPHRQGEWRGLLPEGIRCQQKS